MRYVLLPERTLVVRGPASVTLLAERVTVFDAPISPNQNRVIGANKQLPFETGEVADLEIILGKAGSKFEIKGSTIPESWREAVKAVQEIQEGRIVILGSTDVGKSSLSAYLINNLLRRVKKLRLIDADIGQTDLGPPTTIGVATATQPVTSMSELSAEKLVFIGHTTPSYVERNIIDGVKILLGHSGRSLTIVNTDGWISEPAAVDYKIRLVNSVDPQLVLGVFVGKELEPILANLQYASLKADVAKEAWKRSRSGRRIIRATRYRTALEGATIRKVPLQGLRISLPPGFPEVTSRNRSRFRDLIIGLLDEEDYLLEIGILRDIQHDKLHIYSRHLPAARRVKVGYLRLSPSGRELGFFGRPFSKAMI